MAIAAHAADTYLSQHPKQSPPRWADQRPCRTYPHETAWHRARSPVSTCRRDRMKHDRSSARAFKREHSVRRSSLPLWQSTLDLDLSSNVVVPNQRIQRQTLARPVFPILPVVAARKTRPSRGCCPSAHSASRAALVVHKVSPNKSEQNQQGKPHHLAS